MPTARTEYVPMPCRRRAVAVVLLAVAVAAVIAAGPRAGPVGRAHAQAAGALGASGLPLPRFVSLKSSRVNVRLGPGQDYDIAWVFVRPGLPVEIVQEFDNWRKIRDSDGAEGWVFHSLLSGRRTAMVAPWSRGERFAVRREPKPEAPIAAFLEPRVIANVVECGDGWCEVRGEGFSGWIDQQRLWGVYPNEAVAKQ